MTARFAIEPLESRVLFATDFAGVGLIYGASGPATVGRTFSQESVLSPEFTASGDVFVSAANDRQRDGDILYSAISNLADGRFLRTPDAGLLGTLVESNGARFLSADGYPLGWWYGEYGASSKELELLLDNDRGATESDFEESYRYTAIGYDSGSAPARFFSTTGRLIVGDGRLDWSASYGTIPHSSSTIDSVSADGVLRTARQEYAYLSAGGGVLVWADMRSGDGAVTLGAAVVADGAQTFSTMIGGYLLAYGNTNGGGIDFRQFFLDLEDDGDYKIYDLDEYDDGKREALERGFWRVSGSTLVLEERDTKAEFRLVIGPDGRTIIGQSTESGSASIPVFAVGTRAEPGDGGGSTPPSAPVIVVPATSQFDRSVVYELGPDGTWFEVDLVRVAGGPNITGTTVAWIDPKDSRAYAAAITAQGLVLYTGATDGTWSFRNLTAEAFGGVAIASELGVMVSPDDTVHLTGLTADGHVARYFQNGAQDDSGYRWSFENLSTRYLEPAGLPTPQYAGLVSFSTAWGGLNVVGLDADGAIWSVWWAPGLSAWTVNDLTTLYGAEPLVGGLTVYLTSWQGINIAGIGGDGHIKVTWWVPAFGGDWVQSDLTAETNGPLLDPATVSSYVSTWDGLNVVGADKDSGEIIVYWWSPERVDDGWAITSLSDTVPVGTPVIGAPLSGMAGSNGSLNVFGYTSADTFVRYYWEPSFGGAWSAEHLTDIAVER
ncbi:MAG: hypothetical protein KJZ54_13490 [Phycisphaerales bacterium]|nr:hypothetical protein [Phycisphaerales bacterium]